MPVLTEIEQINKCFDAQRSAYEKLPFSSYKSRKQKLKTLKKHLIAQQEQLAEAINKDFGCRNTTESTLVDLMTVVGQINYTLKNLKEWMRPQRRSSGIMSFPAGAEVHYQPKGLVGVITPWKDMLPASVAGQHILPIAPLV